MGMSAEGHMWGEEEEGGDEVGSCGSARGVKER